MDFFDNFPGESIFIGIRSKLSATVQYATLAADQIKERNINLHRVFITHTGCDDDAGYLMEELEKIATIENLCITIAGSTVSSHCGPNTIGILYLMKY